MRFLFLLCCLCTVASSPSFAAEPRSLLAGTLQRNIGNSYVGDITVELFSLVGIKPEHQGRVIASVLLRAKSENGKGLAALSLAGEDVTEFQSIESGTRTYTFVLPLHQSKVSEEPLELRLRGHIYVDFIAIKLASSH